MADILSYTGNAGLGIGSGKGAAPLGPNDNLKTINDVGRDIMLLDADRNTKIFQQKIADRDNLTQMILKNQVSAGEIDPKYHKEYDTAKDDVEKAYKEWGGDANNVDGYRKYQEKVTHLQDVATHAQTNTLELKKLIQQRAAETLPWKQKALDEHIEQQKNKDFWDHVDPYQQMFSGSVDPLLKMVKTTTVPSTSPDGLWRWNTTKADYDGTLRTAQSEFLGNGETAEDMRWWLNSVERHNPEDKKRIIDSINGQLTKYNSDLGLKDGDKGYASPIDYDPNIGKIKASPVDFSAKYALAQQEKFSASTPPEFQKDYGAYQAKLMDEKMKKAKLDVDWYNAETRRGALNLKQREQKNMTQDEQQFSQAYDNIGKSINLPDISSYKLMGGGDSPFRVNANQVSPGSTYIAGLGPNGQPLQLLPKGVDFSKSNKDPGIVRDKSGNVIGYKGSEGYYDTDFFVPAGTKIGKKTISKDVQLGAKDMYKLYENSGYKGDFKDFVQSKFDSKEIDFQMAGYNGKADRVSSYVSQRALSNKDTKKGQANPYGADEMDLIMSAGDTPDPAETPNQ